MTWNNPYLNGSFNPALGSFPQPYAPQPQPTQVIRVKGRPGADAFAMGPNSSALLLDESGTLVWLCTTDGAGYKTISPYDITPHQDAPAPDYSSLESRISRLEGILNELSGDPSTTGDSKPAASANQKPDGYAPKR